MRIAAYHREVVRTLAQPLTAYITTAALVLILGVAGSFWMLEHEANPSCDSFLDALYFAVATSTTVGYGDIVPVTTPGRVLAIFAMLGGTAIFVGYAGVFASSVIEADRILRADRRQRELAAHADAEKGSDEAGRIA
jgi:voltage-gated potassium channel